MKGGVSGGWEVVIFVSRRIVFKIKLYPFKSCFRHLLTFSLNFSSISPHPKVSFFFFLQRVWFALFLFICFSCILLSSFVPLFLIPNSFSLFSVVFRYKNSPKRLPLVLIFFFFPSNIHFIFKFLLKSEIRFDVKPVFQVLFDIFSIFMDKDFEMYVRFSFRLINIICFYVYFYFLY